MLQYSKQRKLYRDELIVVFLLRVFVPTVWSLERHRWCCRRNTCNSNKTSACCFTRTFSVVKNTYIIFEITILNTCNREKAKEYFRNVHKKIHVVIRSLEFFFFFIANSHILKLLICQESIPSVMCNMVYSVCPYCGTPKFSRGWK